MVEYRQTRRSKNKNKKKKEQHEYDELTLSDIMKRRRFVIIGPGEHIPQWRFTKAYMFNSTIVLGSSFTTKAGLTGNTIAGAGAAYGGALAFAFQDVPAVASYAGIFDQFIILRIVLRIKGMQANVNAGGIDELYVGIDYDNTTVPASRAVMLEINPMQNIRTSGAGYTESLEVDFVPGILVPSVLGNTCVGPRWQDMNVGSNKHLGVKFWYNCGAATDPIFDVEAQYHFGCANFQ